MTRPHRRTTLLVAGLTCGLTARGSTAGADDAPVPVPAPAPVDTTTLSDEELLRLAEEQAGEVIEIWDERPDKPYDRDTEVRLTGEELAARGATDLASALALIPEINVREGGRGGMNIDIRGARKGAVRVLVDGVSVTDPYYGTFDVTTIPVTDIVQIRVSTTPSSPIDGPGGPGGVIEVHTRDAAGAKLVVARLTSDSLPTFGGSATGRVELQPELWLRLSTTALWGLHEYDLASMAQVGESRRATGGALRLEYRTGDRRRIAVDSFVDDRNYVPPPNEESTTANILVIDRETTGRTQLAVDEKRGPLQLQARAWTHALSRRSRYFDDPAFTALVTSEDLFAMRVGTTALATRPIRKTLRWVASGTIDHERTRVESITPTSANVTRGDATLTELAGGLQYERERLRIEGAAGVAAPLGLGADPWPEGKLVTRYRPVAGVELIATLAHKGRTPSLRERFDVVTGNPALGPEIATMGELRVVAAPIEAIELEVAPYYRRAEGTMRGVGSDPRLQNLGTVDVRGVDARARVTPHHTVELGGSVELANDRARNDEAGPWLDDPIDRFPDVRADAWVRATPVEGASGIVRVRYFGDSIDQGMVVPFYALLEASASATLAGDWMAVIRCDDITDEQPETRNGVFLPGRVFSLAVQGTWD